MNYILIMLFYLTWLGSAALSIVLQSDIFLVFSTAFIIPLAIVIALHLFLGREFYGCSLFICHLVMYLFTLYVYIYMDQVFETQIFVFQVFTADNMRMALLVNLVAVATISCVSLLFGNRSLRVHQAEAYRSIVQSLDSIDRHGSSSILYIVALSLVCGLTLAVIGPTVWKIPYPYNVQASPFPTYVMILPTIISFVALAMVHARQLWPRATHRLPLGLLTLSRITFVVSPLLSLMVLGARGFIALMWLTAAGLEFYSSSKKKGTIVWGLIFVVIAYYAITAWPSLRFNLATMELNEAFYHSLERALRLLPQDEPGAAHNLIDLNEFPLIGQSLFHLLYSIDLENRGISLGGSTFINLIPQALPSFLDGVLWHRPLNDNWRLASEIRHAGAFLAIANAYWNGGIAVVAAFMACVTPLFLYLDHHAWKRYTTTIYKFFYFILIPVATVQIFYGIQGLVRPIELLLALIVLEKLQILKPSRKPMWRQKNYHAH